MGELGFRVSGELPLGMSREFDKFMNEESIKINKIIQRDLDKWLKPLPKEYRDRFVIDIRCER
jgi:hypothetical protein